MQDELKCALMAYGIARLAEASQGKARDAGNWAQSAVTFPADAYEAVLSGGRPRPPETALTSVFSLITLDASGKLPPPRYYRAAPLSLDGDAETSPLFPSMQPQKPDGKLWSAFCGELKAVDGDDVDMVFEVFYHLYLKYAWAVPCSYGEVGVSLFEQWKAIAALAFAAGEAWVEGPAAEYTLIGGDIPGIQDFVYTITSKGAAKGLRGRSFFLQLLNDAIVRRIIADLDLSLVNVVCNAGGNFMVLGPAASKTNAMIALIRRQANTCLARALQGETFLVVESNCVAVTDLFSPGRFKKVRDALAGAVATGKRQPLKDVVSNEAGVFAPQGRGSDQSCAVCKVEVDERTSKPLESEGEGDAIVGDRICHLCGSFAELAQGLAHDYLWLVVRPDAQALGQEWDARHDRWDDVLAKATGWRYGLCHERPKTRDGKNLVYAVNSLDLRQGNIMGFRLVANVTPRVDDEDRHLLLEKEKWDESDIPQQGEIRSFAILAKAATWGGAIERVGMLRMDGDGMGHMFSDGLPNLTLPLLSTLSARLDVFFSGYLNSVTKAEGGRDVYVIYAGGDDLFMVGAWHRMPTLAARIRDDFAAYTGEHPALSISGGLTLEEPRFPLYRAAERAKEAEHEAKAVRRRMASGDGCLSFLGTVVAGREEWRQVVELKEMLCRLTRSTDAPGNGRVVKEALPKGLTQLILSIYAQYRAGLREAQRRYRQQPLRADGAKRPKPNPRLLYGRWMWMRLYRLAQMEKRYPMHADDLRRLRDTMLSSDRVHLSGLAARWAEYEMREKK